MPSGCRRRGRPCLEAVDVSGLDEVPTTRGSASSTDGGICTVRGTGGIPTADPRRLTDLGGPAANITPRELNVLNVVTVHWQSSKWIDPQLHYLAKNVDTPYRVFASLNGIVDPEIWKRFHFAADLEGTHAEKLNALARIVYEHSEPSDQLLFLDGDAFPIRPIGTWMESVLSSYALAAVRRDENLGDCQPHPCFCFTTNMLWHEIQGDWREGGTWTNAVRQTTDVGGTLLHQLADRGIEWLPLLRTNTHNVDPLWFGVYAHRVYHHGAGFRPRTSRLDHHADHAAALSPGLGSLGSKIVQQPSLLKNLRSRPIDQLRHATGISLANQKHIREKKKRARRLESADHRIFTRLQSDAEFYREFDTTPP
jgi:hypothetical protein